MFKKTQWVSTKWEGVLGRFGKVKIFKIKGLIQRLLWQGEKKREHKNAGITQNTIENK